MVAHDSTKWIRPASPAWEAKVRGQNAASSTASEQWRTSYSGFVGLDDLGQRLRPGDLKTILPASRFGLEGGESTRPKPYSLVAR
ncbi:hypothetical protein VTH06DRAFT_3218 [Thermothelomyces fergusii]